MTPLKLCCYRLLAIILVVNAGLCAAAGSGYRPVGLKVYQADDVVRARVPGGPIQLGGYVHNLSQALGTVFAARPAGASFGGAVVVVIRPGQQSKKWLLTPAPLPADLQARLQQALDRVPAPAVQGGSLALAMQFQVGSGGPLPAAVLPDLPTPAEWIRALGGPARFPMQDADLAKIWMP